MCIRDRYIPVSGCARSVGVLLTENTAFVVYNLGDSLMIWQYRAEMRTKALMQTILYLSLIHI